MASSPASTISGFFRIDIWFFPIIRLYQQYERGVKRVLLGNTISYGLDTGLLLAPMGKMLLLKGFMANNGILYAMGNYEETGKLCRQAE